MPAPPNPFPESSRLAQEELTFLVFLLVVRATDSGLVCLRV
jgi:hypothetical protein